MTLKKLKRSILTALGLLPLAFFSEEIRAEQSSDSLPTAFSASAPPSTQSMDVFSSTRLIASWQAGKTDGTRLDLLVPLYGDSSHLLFANFQGYQYGSMYKTYSGGIGHRQVINDAIYGVYGFFDRQVSPLKIYHNRYTAGVERLGLTWDFRTNIYLYNRADVTHLVGHGIQGAAIAGNSIVYNHVYDVEAVYNGADVEIGRTLGLDNLRGYLGYYNFGDVIKGPKARVEYQVTPHLGLSASTQTDIRGWLTYVGVNVWLGKTTLSGATGIEARMLEPVVRDMTVASQVVDNYTEFETDPRNIYFAHPGTVNSSLVNNKASYVGDGTQNHPYTLQEAIKNSNNNDIIYLMGSADPYDITHGVTLKPGQTLWTSAADFTSRGYLLLPANTTNPVTLKNGTLTVSNGGILNGFTLEGGTPATEVPGFNGLVIEGTAAVTLTNLNISGFSAANQAGVYVSGAANVTATNVISNNNNAGFSINNANAVFTGSNLTGNSNQIGLYILAGQAQISGSTFNTNAGNGIYVSGTGQLSNLQNVTVSGNKDTETGAIYLGGTASYSTTTYSTIDSTNNLSPGFYLDNPNMTFNGTHLTATGNQVGFVVNQGLANITGTGTGITTNSFSNNTQAGIVVQNTGQLLTLQNATLYKNGTTTGHHGIYFGGTNANASALSYVSSTYNTGTGFYINNPNMTFTGSALTGSNNYIGFYMNQGIANITGSTANVFSNNTANGIYVYGTAQLANLQNTTVSGNKDTVSGAIYLGGTANYSTTTYSSVSSTGNSSAGFYVDNPNMTFNGTNLTGSTNAIGFYVNQGKVNITGTGTGVDTNAFSSNVGNGIFVNTNGQLVALQNTTLTGNQDTISGAISLNGTGTSTFNYVNSSSNSSAGFYVGGANTILNGTNLTGNSNAAGLSIIAGQVQITSGTNSFSNNAGNGIALAGTSTGQLTQLTNTTANNNGTAAATDSIYLGGTAVYTSTFTNVTSSNNTQGSGFALDSSGLTFVGTQLTGSNNANVGLIVNAGTVSSITGTSGALNTFSGNVGSGILVQGTGKLTTLSYTTTSNNGNTLGYGYDGIFLGGTATYTPNLSNITSNSNGYGAAGSGIRIANTNVTFTGTAITANSNSVAGLWLQSGTASITNTVTSGSVFNGNFRGIYATGGNLSSMNNVAVSGNTDVGIFISSAATTAGAYTAISANNNLYGLYLNAGTVSITNTNTAGSSFNSNTGNGIRITGAGVLTGLTNVTANTNGMGAANLNGIRFDGTTTISTVFTAVTTNGNGLHGISIENPNVTLTGNAITSTGNLNTGNGLFMTGGSVTIANNGTQSTFSNNTRGAGIAVFGGTLTGLNNVALTLNNMGLYFSNTTVTSSLVGTNISDNSVAGINIQAGTGTVTVDATSSINQALATYAVLTNTNTGNVTVGTNTNAISTFIGIATASTGTTITVYGGVSFPIPYTINNATRTCEIGKAGGMNTCHA